MNRTHSLLPLAFLGLILTLSATSANARSLRDRTSKHKAASRFLLKSRKTSVALLSAPKALARALRDDRQLVAKLVNARPGSRHWKRWARKHPQLARWIKRNPKAAAWAVKRPGKALQALANRRGPARYRSVAKLPPSKIAQRTRHGQLHRL